MSRHRGSGSFCRQESASRCLGALLHLGDGLLEGSPPSSSADSVKESVDSGLSDPWENHMELVKTAHLVARTFFSVMLCLARARLSTFQSRLKAQVCTSHFTFVMLRIKNTSSSNLLGLHPESFTSLYTTPHQPRQTTCFTKPERASLTGIRTHVSATSMEGHSGYLADSIPHTGYEPKTCIDVTSEHTHSFEENAASTLRISSLPVAASETSDGFQKQAAANGSSQFVPTDEVNPWLSADLRLARSRKLLRSDVSNITNVGETFQDGKEIEILKVCELCLKGKICMSTSSRKLTWLLDKSAQLRDDHLKLKRTWKQESGEKSSSDMALFETSREFESQRLELYQGSERMDQFMWRIGNETDYSMKVAREIAKKFKNCEEFVVKKQIGPDKEELMNCLCNKRGIRPRWVKSWLRTYRIK